jgi:hypothetical protein
MWETNVISDPYGYASSTRPYVEVLAEAAVVVGLAEALIVVWSSSKSKSDTLSSSVSHVSTLGRIIISILIMVSGCIIVHTK